QRARGVRPAPHRERLLGHRRRRVCLLLDDDAGEGDGHAVDFRRSACCSPDHDTQRHRGTENDSAVQEIIMKNALLAIVGAMCAVVALVAQAKINPTDPQPTCNMCPGYYVPLSELQAYTKKAIAERLVDQQVRDIEIGKAHIGIGMVHRGKLDKPAPNSVAEHDQVSEVYHIIDGTATLMLGADITNRQRRPATQLTVRE